MILHSSHTTHTRKPGKSEPLRLHNSSNAKVQGLTHEIMIDHRDCQSISDGQGYSDVVLEYAWLMIHLGLSRDCQDTLARGSTLCMAVHD